MLQVEVPYHIRRTSLKYDPWKDWKKDMDLRCYLNKGLRIWAVLLFWQPQCALCSSAAISTSNSFKELQQIYPVALRKLSNHAYINENDMRPGFKDPFPWRLGMGYSNKDIPRMHVCMNKIVHLERDNINSYKWNHNKLKLYHLFLYVNNWWQLNI